MNWKKRLFKPKWQHKDADIRLQAVGTGQEPELINSLVEIAGSDEDSRVRCAAIKRLHQLGNILKLYGNEADPRVKALLEERIRQLASSSDESRPPLELRLQVVNSTKDRDLIEHMASHAPEAELRRAALARVERQGVLGDCCIEDKDPEIRRFAGDRITQHTTLKRVIEGLRKCDKALYARLQERLHNELLEQADPRAVQAEALKICTALEHLAVEAGEKDTKAIDAQHTAWKRVAKTAKPEMVDRYGRISQRLAAPPASAPPEKKPKPELPAKAKPEIPAEVESAPQTATPQLSSEEKAQLELERQQKQLEKEKKEKKREQFEQELAKAESLLTQFSQELEHGELHKALETRAKIQKLGKGHGKHKGWQRINREMSSMYGRLRELRDWHHWSNDKIRKRLIAEMEVLPSADLHPDALLDRIKSLQAEWKALEKSEQIPGDKHFAAAPWMWRKFSAAGHAAFDTAKPFLEKRSEIQSRHAQSLATFCAELEQLADADPPDWTALGKAMNRGRKKLRDLNSIPAKQRQAFAKQLKAALDKANGAMQDHYAVVEKEKMKLIRAASQLVHLPERDEAIAQAKSLQSSWQAAGSLWRSKEQELWNHFREYLDPLFDELKEQRETIKAADQERLATQKALCTQLKDILKSADDLSAKHGIVQGLQDSWKDIEHPDRRLRTSFQDLLEDYDKQVKQVELQQVQTDRDRWWLKSALLHELAVTGRTKKGAISKKTENKVKKDWPEDSSEEALEMAMDKAREDILAGDAPASAKEDSENLKAQARSLCIQLEFLAGVQSPDEDRNQRMQYQVDRLAESMSGESAQIPAIDEAHDVEKIWLGMYDLPEPDFKTFGERVNLALTTILEHQ